MAIIAGREQDVFDVKYDQRTNRHCCSWILVDPSEKMSWEELIRPTQRSLLMDDTVRKGVGCGNARFVASKKFTSLLGAKLLKVRQTIGADLVG